MQTPKPGLYTNMDMDEYQGASAISGGSLKHMARSPAHYKAALEEKRETETTAALRDGIALHALMQGNGEFERRFVFAPTFDRRTKQGKLDWKEFKKTVGDRLVIPLDTGKVGTLTMPELEAMQKALCTHPKVKDLLDSPHSFKECSIFWNDPETGLLCKCRPDVMRWEWDREREKNLVLIIDYKTIDTAEDWSIEWAVKKYGYGLSAAHYTSWAPETEPGTEPDTEFLYAWVFIEKGSHPGIRIIQASPESLVRARSLRREYLLRIKDCMDTGIWPSYPIETKVITF